MQTRGANDMQTTTTTENVDRFGIERTRAAISALPVDTHWTRSIDLHAELDRAVATETEAQAQPIIDRLDSNTTTPQAREAARRLLAAALRYDACGFPHKYEFKDAEFEQHGPWLYVRFTVGQRNDEGTMAEVVGRTTRYVHIGPRGGVSLVGTRKTTGLDNVVRAVRAGR